MYTNAWRINEELLTKPRHSIPQDKVTSRLGSKSIRKPLNNDCLNFWGKTNLRRQNGLWIEKLNKDTAELYAKTAKLIIRDRQEVLKSYSGKDLYSL